VATTPRVAALPLRTPSGHMQPRRPGVCHQWHQPETSSPGGMPWVHLSPQAPAILRLATWVATTPRVAALPLRTPSGHMQPFGPGARHQWHQAKAAHALPLPLAPNKPPSTCCMGAVPHSGHSRQSCCPPPTHPSAHMQPFGPGACHQWYQAKAANSWPMALGPNDPPSTCCLGGTPHSGHEGQSCCSTPLPPQWPHAATCPQCAPPVAPSRGSAT